MIERFFKFKERNTDLKTEIIAGIATFMAMSYIIAANPLILEAAGMDRGATTLATCIVSGLITILMGLLANYPIALAPGMGINAFFAYTICKGMGIDWRIGLGFFFIEGIIILIITFTKLREIIVNSIPYSLKCAISVGIGLFLTFIGFENAGIITKDPVTFVKLSNFQNIEVLKCVILTSIGLFLITFLLYKKVKGAILIGILTATLMNLLPFFKIKGMELSFLNVNLSPTFFKLDIIGALKIVYIPLIFTLLFVDFFDTIGTIIGVATKAGFVDKDGKIKGVGRVLISDSFGPVVASLFGTSTVTSYIESAAGIEEGGRTGFASLVTGLLFFIVIPFTPFVGFIVPPAVAPALIIVGIMMMEPILRINFNDYTESVPAFITLISMPFTYSISNGIFLGFISYVVIKLITGRIKEISPVMFILSLFFIIFFVLNPIG
uniref:NCS2 family permease n=1 Tax=candidate division WOR-3 bacterium TaxID=2052148 RepID=A0A7C4Y4J6_UNCW3